MKAEVIVHPAATALHDALIGWRYAELAAELAELPADHKSLTLAALAVSMDPEAVEAVLGRVGGHPCAPLSSLHHAMTEARLWASYASREDLKSHALAAFEAMTAHDRAAFLAHVEGLADD